MDVASPSRKNVERAVALAEEGRQLEAEGRKEAAVQKLADACQLLLVEAHKVESLRGPLEDLLLRAERLKAEAVWEKRARVTRLYESQSVCYTEPQPKGLGTFVSQGHSSFGVVVCLMAGLRRACLLDSACPREMLPAMLVAREEKAEFDECPQHERFSLTVHHPEVFRFLRMRVFGLELLDSVGTRGMFELASPGKSGSFLFFTSDMQFLVKTVSGEERDAFQCPDYYHHMSQRRDSLLNRIVLFASITRYVPAPPASGLTEYAKRLWGGDGVAGGATQTTVHFVVLENIVPPHRAPTELYDLKGSTLGRSSAKEQEKARSSGKLVILKDLDVRRKLSLTPEMGRLLIETLQGDVAWLQRQNVMDYSLLLAVCPNDEAAGGRKAGLRNSVAAVGDYCTCCGSQTGVRKPCTECKLPVCVYCCDESRGLAPCHICYGFETCPILTRDVVQTPLPVAKRNASVFRAQDGGVAATSADGTRVLPETYFIGVIDFLQPFNLRKVVEQKVKTVVLAGGDEMQISVLQPDKYAARLVEFVKKLL